MSSLRASRNSVFLDSSYVQRSTVTQRPTLAQSEHGLERFPEQRELPPQLRQVELERPYLLPVGNLESAEHQPRVQRLLYLPAEQQNSRHRVKRRDKEFVRRLRSESRHCLPLFLQVVEVVYAVARNYQLLQRLQLLAQQICYLLIRLLLQVFAVFDAQRCALVYELLPNLYPHSQTHTEVVRFRDLAPPLERNDHVHEGVAHSEGVLHNFSLELALAAVADVGGLAVLEVESAEHGLVHGLCGVRRKVLLSRLGTFISSHSCWNRTRNSLNGKVKSSSIPSASLLSASLVSVTISTISSHNLASLLSFHCSNISFCFSGSSGAFFLAFFGINLLSLFPYISTNVCITQFNTKLAIIRNGIYEGREGGVER